MGDRKAPTPSPTKQRKPDPPPAPPAREDSGRKISEGGFIPTADPRYRRRAPRPPSPFPPNRTIADPGFGPVAYIVGGLIAGAVCVVVLQAVGFWPWP